MRRYDGLESVRAGSTTESSIVTLGVFDGMHRGHQDIVGEVRSWARAVGAAAWVLTFENHPELLSRGSAPPMITTTDHRLRLLESLGVDACWLVRFDESLRSLSAEEFVTGVLVKRLRAAGVVLGQGARFGYGGRGDVNLLREMGGRLGFAIRERATQVMDGAPISSTRIRLAIRRGELDLATRMLGRPYSLLGTVVRGEGRGARIGIPTANLGGELGLLPPVGVYVTQSVFEQDVRPSVTNLGYRPTFAQDGKLDARPTVETHVLDFSGDLVGATIEVRFLEKIRDEISFPDADSLVARIRSDMVVARERSGKWTRLTEKGLTPQPGEI